MDPALATRPHPSHTGERRLYAVVRIRTLAGGPGINTDRCPWLVGTGPLFAVALRSEAHTSELQSLMRISYAVFCLNNTNRNSTRPTSSHYLTYRLLPHYSKQKTVIYPYLNTHCTIN